MMWRGMTWPLRTIAVAAVFGVMMLAYLIAAPSVSADTPGCVSHAEYDGLERGLTPGQVAARFDTNGSFRGSGDAFFSRNYNPCWDNPGDKRVVVWYALDNGLSDHWDVRDPA